MNWWKWILSLFAKQPKPKPVPVPDKPTEPAGTDALPVDSIASWKDVNVNPKDWPVTHSLAVKLYGRKAIITTEAVKAWKDGGGDVCANLHFIVKRGGVWRAYCFDYARPGQTEKDKAPPRPPCKEGESYETVAPGEECYLVLTGLCRDKRRNVSARSNIVRVQ